MSAAKTFVLLFLFAVLSIVALSSSVSQVQAALPSPNIPFVNRDYYIAGDFTHVTDESGKPVSGTQYLARLVGGKTFESIGQPDGPVNIVRVDYCGNVWIGGSFTKVGNTQTGPLAVLRRKNNAFDVVGSADWTPGSTVRDIDVNCFNYDTLSSGVCSTKQCDAYVTGAFAKAGGVAANNVAWYDGSSSSWKAIGNGVNLAAGSDGGNAIRYNFFTKEVYVGGDFATPGNAQLAKSDGTWSALPNAPNGIVRAFYLQYDPKGLVTTGDHKLYMVGDFSTPGSRAAVYSNKDKATTQLTSTTLDGSGYDVDMSDDGVVVAGAFDTPQKGIVRVSSSSYVALSSKTAPYGDYPVNAISVCRTVDSVLKCPKGDTLIGGPNPLMYDADNMTDSSQYRGLAYYSKTEDTYTSIGFGVNGTVVSIADFISSGVSVRASFVAVFGFIAAVLALVL